MAKRGRLSAADRKLGMGCSIDRRDFLNGIAIATGTAGLTGALLPDLMGSAIAAEAVPQDRPGYYPPILTGMRGSHPGSFEAAHSLRDGTFWDHENGMTDTGEHYDLVVIGGGISGLSAAHFYRTAKPKARILILENHDDFGGHAKRNEFDPGGGMELINGGTLEIDSPRPYSAIADGLLKTLGIDPVALKKKCAVPDFYQSNGLEVASFFDKETFGADKLAVGKDKKPWAEFLAGAPLSDAVKRDIARIQEAKVDYMPGLSSAEKKDKLSRISYANFLTEIVKADPGVLPYYQAITHAEWGVGIDAISALDLWGFYFPEPEAPGFQGLNLTPGSAPRMGNTAAGYADGGSYTFHFPDGNASIARLLVRNLIPRAIPGSSAEDVVTAKADYAKLDRPGSPVRIRLSSIVVGARNIGGPASSKGVEIAYTRGGQVYRVRAKDCLLACYNMMIPYLCPDLPEKQKAALHYLVKIPLIYTNVAIRNWRSFKALGIWAVYAPGSYHSSFRLNPVTDIGGYKSVRSPDEPMLVHMVRTPVQPGLDERSQHRAGRAEMLATPFADIERSVRDQLGRTLGPGGFDPARDITAITVNRWPHGYAYEYNPLFDPDWAPGQAPHLLGRVRHGRIAIANSDAGAAAYTDCAMEQGHRAVQELLAI